MFQKRICTHLLIVLVAMTGVLAQSTKKPLTNSDVIDMVHAGLAESTIVLAIKNSGTNFDTSPKALIELKKIGVSQTVLDAMLSAASSSPELPRVASSGASGPGDSKALVAKVVEALGGEKAINEVKATRFTSTREVKAPMNTTLEVVNTTVYPDRVHVAIRSSKFNSVSVYRPDSSFMVVNGKQQPIPEPAQQETAKSIKMGLIYVAQHASDPKYTFTINGSEKIGDTQTATLEIATENIQTRWNIDPATGRIIRVTRMVAGPSGAPMLASFEYADWRTISGVTIPFKVLLNGVPLEEIKSYEINPVIAAGLFDKASEANSPAANMAPQSVSATTGCPIEILEVNPHAYVGTSEDPWGWALKIKYRNVTSKQIIAEKFAANFFNALHEKKQSAWNYTGDQKIKPRETKNVTWGDGVYVNEIGMRIGAEVWPVKMMFADETFWEDDGSMQCKSAVWATPVK